MSFNESVSDLNSNEFKSPPSAKHCRENVIKFRNGRVLNDNEKTILYNHCIFYIILARAKMQVGTAASHDPDRVLCLATVNMTTRLTLLNTFISKF